MGSIKRAVIFGAIPAIVVVIILISVAAFYTKEVYTEIDTQAPKQHVWMIMTNNTELGLKQHDFDNIYHYNNIPTYYYVPNVYVIEQDFNSKSLLSPSEHQPIS
jgi:hypothetical protein